jgi:hypothetical protein
MALRIGVEKQKAVGGRDSLTCCLKMGRPLKNIKIV